ASVRSSWRPDVGVVVGVLVGGAWAVLGLLRGDLLGAGPRQVGEVIEPGELRLRVVLARRRQASGIVEGAGRQRDISRAVRALEGQRRSAIATECARHLVRAQEAFPLPAGPDDGG